MDRYHSREPAAWEWLRQTARTSRRTVVAVARDLLAEFGQADVATDRPG